MRRRLSLPAAIAAALAAAVLVSPASAVGPQPTTQDTGLARVAGEQASVVEVLLTGTDQLDELVATGVDLDHMVRRSDSGVVAHAVITATEAEVAASGRFPARQRAVQPG